MQPILSVIDNTAHVWRADFSLPVRLHKAIVAEQPELIKESDSSVISTFQIPEGSGSLEVMWAGFANSGRTIELSYQDEAKWRVLGTAAGADDEKVFLRAVLPSHLEKATLRVQVYDPFADDLKHKESPDHTDLTIGWISDTQKTVEYSFSDDEKVAKRHRDALFKEYKFLAKQPCDVFVHTGDVVENLCNEKKKPKVYKRGLEELELSLEAMKPLVKTGKPLIVAPGNHDNHSGSDGTDLNEQLILPLLKNSKGFIGGMKAKKDPSSMWIKVPYGDGDDWVLFLSVPYAPSKSDLSYAESVLEEHSDIPTVLVAHDYLRPTMRPDGRYGIRSYLKKPKKKFVQHEGLGQLIFERLVEPYKQVGLVLCGHDRGVAMCLERDVAETGHHVVEMMANYQSYRMDGDYINGFIRILSLNLRDGIMHVKTISPFTDRPPADYDPIAERNFTADADNFSVPLALGGKRKSVLKTELFSVARRDSEVLETLTAGVSESSLDPSEYDALWASIKDRTQLVEPGSIVYPSCLESPADENGIIQMGSGLIRHPNGVIEDSSGYLYFEDGSTKFPNGYIEKADGTLRAPDGWVFHPNGIATNPDGQIINP